MLFYVARRTAEFAASLILASIAIFTFMAVLPGDPAQVTLGVNATPEALAETRARFGTDKPLLTQYLDWVGGLPRGDFGRSYVTSDAIGGQILERLQVTLWLVISAMVLAIAVAVPLGVLAALRHRHPSGAFLSGLSQVGIAIPSFLAGILLVALFAVRTRLLPSGGWTAPVENPVEFGEHLVLPVLSLAVVQAAILARYVRSSILDVLREDYLRTARAKGMGRRRALVRHGFRNAAIPVVTVLGLQLTTLLIGAVVVERVFVIPGLGSLLLDGTANRDLLLVRGVVMVLVVAVLFVNFVVDLLYPVIDPRLRRA
jgi:peptide/nickel transport system permease protein